MNNQFLKKTSGLIFVTTKKFFRQGSLPRKRHKTEKLSKHKEHHSKVHRFSHISANALNLKSNEKLPGDINSLHLESSSDEHIFLSN